MPIAESTQHSILGSLLRHWAQARTSRSFLVRWLIIEKFIRSSLLTAFALAWRRLSRAVLFPPASYSSLAVELRCVVFRLTQPGRRDSYLFAMCWKENQDASMSPSQWAESNCSS